MSCIHVILTPPPKKKGGVAVHINVVFDILVDQNGGRKF